MPKNNEGTLSILNLKRAALKRQTSNVFSAEKSE
jgi:hypothetical protein